MRNYKSYLDFRNYINFISYCEKHFSFFFLILEMSVISSSILDQFTRFLEKLLEFKEKYPDSMNVTIVGGMICFCILKIPSGLMDIVNKVESLLNMILKELLKEGKTLFSLGLKLQNEPIVDLKITKLNSDKTD